MAQTWRVKVSSSVVNCLTTYITYKHHMQWMQEGCFAWKEWKELCEDVSHFNLYINCANAEKSKNIFNQSDTSMKHSLCTNLSISGRSFNQDIVQLLKYDVLHCTHKCHWCAKLITVTFKRVNQVYLLSHSFSNSELQSCEVLALCCSSKASRSSSGVWTKCFSKSCTSSSKL